MATALLRSIPESFRDAITGERGRPPDVELARAQHARYRDHLEASGYAIEALAADEAHPDCVFVEDTVVIIGSVALITWPGAPSRRGEIEPVAAALADRFEIARAGAPATLDGGDVFTLGNRTWVGISQRTNPEGAQRVGEVASGQGLGVVPVPVTGVLHLKSAVSPVDEETVVVTPGTVDESLLTGLRLIYEDPGERHRFSALPLRTGRVMVTANAPRTADQLAAKGLEPIPIDVSEIQAADGGLTCISVLF